MSTKRQTFKFLCFIKKNKKLKTGNAPLYGRRTLNGTQVEFSLHQKVKEKLWSQKAGRSIGRDNECSTLNDFIDQVENPGLAST